jgi:hypothetical protein
MGGEERRGEVRRRENIFTLHLRIQERCGRGLDE